MTIADVLLPAYNRLPSPIMTLSGLASRTVSDLRMIVVDQSAKPANRSQVIQILLSGWHVVSRRPATARAGD